MKYYEIENLYCENIDINILIDTLNNSTDILEYYGIIHDSDFKDTGEIKKPHIHLYVGFEDYGRYTIEKCREFFKPLTSRVNSVKSIKLAIQYLVHLNDRNKYQYDINDIFTNNKDKMLKQFQEKEKDLNELLELFIKKIYDFEITSNTNIIDFFKVNNKLNYCVSHYRYLIEIKDTIINSYEIERKKEREDLKEC